MVATSDFGVTLIALKAMFCSSELIRRITIKQQVKIFNRWRNVDLKLF